MKNASILIFSLLLHGCTPSSQVTRQSSPNYSKQGFVNRAFLGARIIKNLDNQIEIIGVLQNGGAAKAGLKSGDIIKAIENRPVRERIDLIDFIANSKQGDSVLVTVLRGTIRKNLFVKITKVDVPIVFDAIKRFVWQEKRVTLVILVGEISFIGPTTATQLQSWKEATKSELIAQTEEGLLKTFLSENNFSIVDRYRVDEISKEIMLGQSGLVSESLRNKLGEMLGATHILFIQYSQYPEMHVHTQRLIEIETGKVLASAVYRSMRVSK